MKPARGHPLFLCEFWMCISIVDWDKKKVPQFLGGLTLTFRGHVRSKIFSPFESRWSGEIGEVGIGEVRFGEVRFGEVGIGEMGFGEVGIGQVGIGEVGLNKAAMNGESSTANFWMTQVGTGSSLEDLHAALLMRCCTAAALMDWIPPCGKHMVVHWRPVGQQMQSLILSLRVSPGRHPRIAWQWARLEFGGFDSSFLRTLERCRHSFLGSPLLSEFFFSQNWFCLTANSCCFFLACPIQTNRSESSFVLRYRRSNALVRRLALAQSASNRV